MKKNISQTFKTLWIRRSVGTIQSTDSDDRICSQANKARRAINELQVKNVFSHVTSSHANLLEHNKLFTQDKSSDRIG